MLETGSEIHGYRIERLLGRGGMGEVYEATQMQLRRTVALKLLDTRLGQDEGFRERFRREGRIQAGLEHPNVVGVYEAGEHDGGLFLAMRLIKGSTLKQLIVARELDAARTLELLLPVAGALDAAHASGLIHRDVKPQNILVEEDGHPYLADFGLTRGSEDSGGLTVSGEFLGTIDYIAPEQVRGEQAGPAGDRYSLAAVLFECLTGAVPYPKPSPSAVLYAHAHDPVPRVTEYREELPGAVDEVIDWGMAKEPEERPATAVELVEQATAAIGGDSEVKRSRPPAVTHRVQTGVRAVPGDTDGPATPATLAVRRALTPRNLALAGGAALLLLALAAFLVGRGGGSEAGGDLAVTASSSALELGAPPGWSRAARPPQVPGLELSQSVTLTPPSPSGATVAGGMTKATGSTLLPADLRRRVLGRLPSGRPTALGDLEALRYPGVRVRGFTDELTLFAAPTTAGVATVACYVPPSAATAFAPSCTRVAQTLELVDGEPVPLSVTRSAVQSLAATVGGLAKERAKARARLAQARTPGGQAKVAAELSRIYARSASRLSRLALSPTVSEEKGAAVAALRASERAYRDLATAARRSDARGYRRVSRRIARAEGLVRRRFAELERAIERGPG